MLPEPTLIENFAIFWYLRKFFQYLIPLCLFFVWGMRCATCGFAKTFYAETQRTDCCRFQCVSCFRKVVWKLSGIWLLSRTNCLWKQLPPCCSGPLHQACCWTINNWLLFFNVNSGSCVSFGAFFKTFFKTLKKN